MSGRAEKRAAAEIRRFHREDRLADKKSLQSMAARITELEAALRPFLVALDEGRAPRLEDYDAAREVLTSH